MQTKEEIFLGLFQREYDRWNENLTAILNGNVQLTKKELADHIANSLAGREQLLKLLSMNNYDMEANSRQELLNTFKQSYGRSMRLMCMLLEKFCPEMSVQDIQNFIYTFYLFMFGIYSAALGKRALAVRIITCFLCGCAAWLLIFAFYRKRFFFDFTGFEERASHDTHPNLLIRYLLNVWRNVKATGLYFLFGILLSALFQRYVPQNLMVNVFGGNEAWGVLMAATIGVPLYACGGGTIPLLQQWLWQGMSLGSAAAFMITGPATKITNLGALKIAMGWKRFVLYILFVMLFSFICGITVNLIV